MNDKYDFLDSLKGIAIIGIVLIHSGNNIDRECTPLWEAIISNGNKGVQIFFLISAILMYQSYVRYHDKITTMSIRNCIHWYAKRFVRLIPLFWLTNTAVLVFGAITTGNLSPDQVLVYLSNCLFLHGLIPGHINAIGNNWYLGTLALFILLIPLIHAVAGSIWRALLLLCGTYLFQQFVIPVIAAYDYGQDMGVWNGYWNGFGITKQMPVLMLGIVLYYFIFEYRLPNIWMKQLQNLMGEEIAGVVIYGIYVFVFAGLIRSIVTYQNIYVFAVLFSCLIVLLFIKPIGIIHNPVFYLLGKYSYGIYLFHLLILGRINHFMSRFLGNSVWNILCSLIFTLCICLVASILAVKYYERPVIDFLKRKMN